VSEKLSPLRSWEPASSVTVRATPRSHAAGCDVGPRCADESTCLLSSEPDPEAARLSSPSLGGMKPVSLVCLALAFGCPASDTTNDDEEQPDAEVHENASDAADAGVAHDAAAEPDASSDDGGAIDAGPDAEVRCDDDGGSASALCLDYQELREELLRSIAEAECSPEACPMVAVVAQGAKARGDSSGRWVSARILRPGLRHPLLRTPSRSPTTSWAKRVRRPRIPKPGSTGPLATKASRSSIHSCTTPSPREVRSPASDAADQRTMVVQHGSASRSP
jgi:hypothetical protein